MAEQFKVDPHSPEKLGGIPWLVCKKCGLVYLRNDFTAWCVKQGCDNAEHPSYRSQANKVSPW